MSDDGSYDSNESYQYSDSDEEMTDDHSADDSVEPQDQKNGNRKEFSKSSRQTSRKSDGNPNAAPVRNVPMEILSTVPKGIRMLDSAELFPIMKARIAEVTEVLGVPASAASILLRENQWVKERLFETYYEDSEKVQEKCGVRARCGRGENKSFKSDSSRANMCKICTDTKGKMLAMPCSHEFCLDCWEDFVSYMISGGPSCVRTSCPQAGCHEAVTEEEVEAALPSMLSKFQSYQLRSFVESNGMARWCPGPGCTRVAMMMGGSGFEHPHGVAECDDCDTSFCMRCGLEPHAPSTCKELVRWREKCRNESETANWILANTKPCPKCQSRIEKNQGCNHIVCQQCKYEFCWICCFPWSDHGASTGGYYKCNKFDSNTNTDDMSDAAKAKRELDRYLHYYKRYHAHSEAQNFAKKQLADTEARMILLQESTSESSTWTDVEFLKAAVEQLVECRRVLKYTYTFAYYLTDKSKQRQRETFEHHQEMLEKFTEKLSELSEKPLSEMDRTDVVNQTRVVDRFMKNVLKYVEEGMDSDKEDQMFATYITAD